MRLRQAAWILAVVAASGVVGGCGHREAPDGPHETWPDARTTGASTTKRVVGVQYLKESGATLSDVEVDGPVVVDADDARISNVVVRSHGPYGIVVHGARAVIEDSTVQGTPGTTLAGIAADGGSFRAKRVDVFGSEDGVRLGDDSALEDSWVHGLAGGSDAHFDAVTADGYTGWRVTGNRIENNHAQTAALWVGDPRGRRSSGTVEHNLLSGGGYTVYAGPGAAPGIVVEHNAFSAANFADGGRYGPVTGWVPENNVWRDNVWYGGSRHGRKVEP